MFAELVKMLFTSKEPNVSSGYSHETATGPHLELTEFSRTSRAYFFNNNFNIILQSTPT
jgi:hypothetical protein